MRKAPACRKPPFFEQFQRQDHRPTMPAGIYRSRGGLEGGLLAGCGLETEPSLWEFHTMNAVKVDQAHRITLPELRPGDYYESVIGPNGEHVTLRRLRSARSRLTSEE